MTTSTTAVDRENQDANRDPMTDEPGAHPVGTGVGAATGGTVGAVIGGAVGGPVGAMVGAAVGAVAGGLAGKGISESVNPTEEDAFWRDHYSTRPYASGRRYEDLQPAYRYGWEARTRHENRSWNDVEGDLERDWNQRYGSSGLGWNDARHATRDAWDRVEARHRFNTEEDNYWRNNYGGTAAGAVASGMAGHELGTKGLSEGPTHLGQQTGPATSTGTTLSSPAGSHLTGSGGTMTADSIGTGTAATGLAGGTPSTITGTNAATGPTSGSIFTNEAGSKLTGSSNDGAPTDQLAEKTQTVSYNYQDYRPAYWYGWEAGQSHRGRTWEAVANELEGGWEQARRDSRLSWVEARDVVRDAWTRAASLQSSPPRRRPAVEVPLQELHDSTGRLHAGKIADYLQIPLKQFAEALGKNYSTVHRTPSALALQVTLRSIKSSLVILEEVLGDRTRVLAWLNHPHPDLGRQTPMEVILKGNAQVIQDMLEAALEGIPS
jgi:uncharacterized protein YcfJ